MIDIQQLQLQLPEGYENRAGRIVRLLGEALATHSLSRSQQLAQLRVGPVELPKGATDRQAAERIARAIHAQLPGEV